MTSDPWPAQGAIRTARWRRRLRRLAVGAALTVVALLVASVVYNVATTPADTFTAPDGDDVTVSGVRVHYRMWGDHGTPIVLVPGFAESTASWGPSTERLAAEHRVVAVDLPGAGYTQSDRALAGQSSRWRTSRTSSRHP